MIRHLALTVLMLMSTQAASLHRAAAAESEPITSERATATLVSDTDTVSGQPFRVGLRLRMAPNWHSYWRNSGDAGAPTEMTLTLPEGARAGEIAWPAPRVVSESEVVTYGYTGEVLLPVVITPAPGGGRDMAIAAHASWLVCSTICVPDEADFHLTLPAGTGGPSAQAALFTAADQRMPMASPYAIKAAPDGTLTVTGQGLSAASVAHARFIPNDPGVIVDAVHQRFAAYDGGFTLAMKPAAKFAPASLAGVLEIADQGGQTTALRVALGEAPAAATPPAAVATPAAALAGTLSLPANEAMPFGRMLLFGFLGGMVLNLMPCVFPVLAMKAVSMVRLSGAARMAVRMHSLSYSAGVVVSFTGLGMTLLAARAAGSAAGWGFQFQSPVFVTGVTWLLFGVGLSLSGVYHIGGHGTGAGQGLCAKHGHTGSFFTGFLAVLVATPCTAPFMGAALAAALAATPLVTVAVFIALGVGLATPYLLLAAFPALARLAPKPGRWMDVVKQALAFPMYAAAAWLLWVISQEAGSTGVLASAVGLVLIGFGAWAFGVAQDSEARGSRRAGRVVALAAGLAALAVLGRVATADAEPQQAAENARGEEPFSASRLAALRAEGRPVFVNMTAAWCVTCLVNEHAAIGTAAVRQALTDRRIAYLKGDWTRQDPQITDFLRQHGRDGVPLYAFYPAGAKEAVILPQILTEGLVLDGLATSAPAS